MQVQSWATLCSCCYRSGLKWILKEYLNSTYYIFSIFVQKLISCFFERSKLKCRIGSGLLFTMIFPMTTTFFWLTDLIWHYSLPIKGGYVYLFWQRKSHGYPYSTFFLNSAHLSALEYDKNYEMKWKSVLKVSFGWKICFWFLLTFIYRNILECFWKRSCIKIRIVLQKLFQLIVAIEGETRRGRLTKKSAKIRRKNQFSNGHIEIRPG